MKRLQGKSAIVTGAANGIGRAIAEVFADEGAFVVVADVEAENGEAVAAAIRATGGEAEFHKTDVTNTSDIQAAVAAAAAHAGRIDILCNNAAYLAEFHAVLDATAA